MLGGREEGASTAGVPVFTGTLTQGGGGAVSAWVCWACCKMRAHTHTLSVTHSHSQSHRVAEAQHLGLLGLLEEVAATERRGRFSAETEAQRARRRR